MASRPSPALCAASAFAERAQDADDDHKSFRDAEAQTRHDLAGEDGQHACSRKLCAENFYGTARLYSAGRRAAHAR
jgi:hypothetical protein